MDGQKQEIFDELSLLSDVLTKMNSVFFSEKPAKEKAIEKISNKILELVDKL
jgi:hypothetical protein